MSLRAGVSPERARHDVQLLLLWATSRFLQKSHVSNLHFNMAPTAASRSQQEQKRHYKYVPCPLKTAQCCAQVEPRLADFCDDDPAPWVQQLARVAQNDL